MNKARVTTLLSLTGVLVAGSAAALVNTQVLGNTVPRSQAAAEVSVTTPSSPPSSPVTTASGATSSTEAEVTTSASAASATQQAYQIEGVGLVTLDTAGDVLRTVAVTPQAGWTVLEIEQKDALNIEVKFESATLLVEFKANLLYGIISTSVESDPIATGGSAPSNSTNSSTGGTSNTIDDDDDDHTSTSDDKHDDDDDSGKGSGRGGDDDRDDD